MSKTLNVRIESQVEIITLNRPEKKNAFNNEMINEWVGALEEAKNREDVNVVLITGAGDAFCSGGDVTDMKKENETASLDSKNELWRNIHRIPFILKEMDKPVIAAINGSAVGAGLDMALMTDIRTMASTAQVSEGYVKVGLVSGNGGSYFLPKIVGESKAYELLWTGDFIDAKEALRLGLVNRVYNEKDFMSKTLELAKKIASGPQVSIRMTKRAVRQSSNFELESALDLLSSHMAIVRNTEDYSEGVSAFLEKRKPKFKGR